MKPFSFLFFLFTVFCLLVSCRKDTSPLGRSPGQPDTTSHNFSWTFDTIGTNWSILLDVAIIDENEIWAVGEIHTAETDTFDSLGNWIPPYNAVHWDGQEWELKRIPYIYNGSPIISPIKWIYAFNENDILFGNSVHWNGQNFQNADIAISIFSGIGINKMWGSPNRELYVVGNQGTIAYSPDHGSTWQKLESGTDVDIQDIWGAMNPQTGEYEILAVASFSIGVPQAKQLLRIDGMTVSTVPDSGLPLALETIWFAPGKEYFVGGPGIFHTSDISKTWELDTRQPLFYMNSIRGIDVNDIIMAGSDGYISHYNGSSSRLYTGTELPEFFGNYYAAAVHPKVVVAVGGYEGRKGVVAVGKCLTQK